MFLPGLCVLPGKAGSILRSCTLSSAPHPLLPRPPGDFQCILGRCEVWLQRYLSPHNSPDIPSRLLSVCLFSSAVKCHFDPRGGWVCFGTFWFVPRPCCVFTHPPQACGTAAAVSRSVTWQGWSPHITSAFQNFPGYSACLFFLINLRLTSFCFL